MKCGSGLNTNVLVNLASDVIHLAYTKLRVNIVELRRLFPEFIFDSKESSTTENIESTNEVKETHTACVKQVLPCSERDMKFTMGQLAVWRTEKTPDRARLSASVQQPGLKTGLNISDLKAIQIPMQLE